MFTQPWLAAAAVFCAVAAVLWGRAAARLARAARRIEAETASSSHGRDATELARAAFDKDLHTALLYAVLTVGLAVASISRSPWYQLPLLAVSIPVVVSIRYAPRFFAEARLAENRAMLERRAEEVLAQEELAPRRWADRLAPEDLPHIEGFELGRVYEPGTGMMAGDFYDVFVTASHRIGVVIGDVAGHGIEPSITAFQVKYLLRTFLRSTGTRPRPSRSSTRCCRPAAGPRTWCRCAWWCSTPRRAPCATPRPAIRPPGCGRTPRCARCAPPGRCSPSTPARSYFSREVPLTTGDVLLLYTDGLAEARSGGQIFGEDRIAGIIRRDPGQDATILCKTLLEAARDFASEPLTDDVAILAVRRV